MIAIAKLPADALAPRMALTHFLNFSRGSAALLVLFFHIRTALLIQYNSLETHGWLTQAVYLVSAFGHDAVIVFFVLSGYLVGGVVIRLDMTSPPDLWEYCVDRAVRIGPVLVAATAFAVVLQYLMPLADCGDKVATVFGNALALQNFLVKPLCNDLPLWSISNEVVYYFVFPVMIVSIAGTFSIRFLLPLTCVVLIAVLSLTVTPLDDTNIVGDFPFWLVGALLWFVPARFKHLWWVALLLLTAALMFGRFDLGKHHFWFRDLALSVAFSFFLVTFLDRSMPRSGIQAIIAGRVAKWSKWFAELSFSLYVLHYPLIRFYADVVLKQGPYSARYTSVTAPIVLQFIGLSASCVLFAFCFRELFEKPRQFLKNVIMRRMQRCGYGSSS